VQVRFGEERLGNSRLRPVSYSTSYGERIHVSDRYYRPLQPLCSRLGLSNTLEAECSLDVLKRAISLYGKPEIINSDQGIQFTCKLWIDYLEGNEIKISMDGKGRVIDNIFIERLWRSVKYDYVYLHPANNGRELYIGLQEYFDYYNHHQSHQGIGRRIPAELFKPAA
jgi:putative transposase